MFTEGQFIEFIERCFGPSQITGRNSNCNINIICPICIQTKEPGYNKKKLAIKLDNHVVKCWVCGYKSRDLYNLIKRFKPNLLQEYENTFSTRDNTGRNSIIIQSFDEKILKNETISLPNGFILLAPLFYEKEVDWRIKSAKKYLLGRGLEYKDFWYWKFGITFEDIDYKGRIIIPSFDNGGNLNYFTSRAISPKNKQRYYNPGFTRETVIFNEINIDWSNELTLVEGPFDLVKCNENATCILGKEFNLNYLLFQKIVQNQTPILSALDKDETKQILKIAKLLTEYGVNVRIYDLPKNRKDVGEMSKDEFISQIPSAKMFQMEDCFRYKIEAL